MSEAIQPFTGLPEGPKTYLWTPEQMPAPADHQIAATTEEAAAPGFDRGANRIAHIQWFQPPAEANRTDACMVIISGGGYDTCCDIPAFVPFVQRLQAAGIVCVNFTYRTPRPKDRPPYWTAWKDGQRAIRMIRAAAKEHRFDPEKIGVVGCSAGSHLCMLLGLSSQTRAYEPVDALDETPCHVNWSIPMCPAYALTDGLATPNARGGHGADVVVDPVFAFDEKTCPVCFMHGGDDPYSPMASLKAYCRLRQMGLPAELHLEAYAVHGFMNYKRLDTAGIAINFLKRMGFIPTPEGETIGRSRASASEDVAMACAWEVRQLAGAQSDLGLIA